MGPKEMDSSVASLRGWQGLPQTLRISLPGTLKGLCNGNWGGGGVLSELPWVPTDLACFLSLQTYSQ